MASRKPIVLPDTSLCAIVRDEKINPAGGIRRFVKSHVPYVEEAVIADTGSIDGTREILEELQAEYRNLRVVDIPFNGYADARNQSLKHVKTRRALVLDADELLTHKKPQNDWKLLKEILEENPEEKIYFFSFLSVPPFGKPYHDTNVHHHRLFDVSKDVHFSNAVWESLSFVDGISPLRVYGLSIKHFLPSSDAIGKKYENWYRPLKRCLDASSPSEAEGFRAWKKFNPRREEYA